MIGASRRMISLSRDSPSNLMTSEGLRCRGTAYSGPVESQYTVRLDVQTPLI